MGRKCCVPYCNSNYNNTSEYVTVFFFPKDPVRREKWKRLINRLDFEPTSESVVCVKHFSSQFLVQDKIKKRNLKELTYRVKPKLTEDAYPTIFPRPSGSRKHKNVEENEEMESSNEQIDDDIEDSKDNIVVDQFLLENLIVSFEDLCSEYKSKDFSPFVDIPSTESLVFIKLKTKDLDKSCPEIELSIVINTSLQVKVYSSGRPLNEKEYTLFLGNDRLITRWSQFDSLFNHFRDFDSLERDIFDQMQEIAESVKDLKEKVVPDDLILAKRLKFIEDQLSMTAAKSPKYSLSLLLWACAFYFDNPSVYTRVRNTNVLILPHPERLKSLFFSKETLHTTSYIEFLKKKCNALQLHERNINITLDEIKIKPVLLNESDNEALVSVTSEANKMQVFMFNSVFSSHKDLVGLFPLKNFDSVTLYQYTKLVIKMLTKAGFKIVSITSEYNETYKQLFETFFSNSTIENSLQNPFDPPQEIFILFDTVDLIKRIRNDWLNKEDSEKTMLIPLFEFNPGSSFRIHNPDLETEILNCKALFSDIRDVYWCEQNLQTNSEHSVSVLSRNVLYPSTFERDNISLTLKLFDEKLIMALKTTSTITVSPGTISLLEILSNWWKCVGEKPPSFGVRIKDEFGNVNNHIFLESFYNWLNMWDSFEVIINDEATGKLNPDTFFALKHTTESLLNLSTSFSAEDFGKIYLGQFQIDPLEFKLGQCRRERGWQSTNMIEQVLQYEINLNEKTILTLKSSNMGEFEIREFFTDNFSSDDDKLEVFEDQFLDGIIDQYDHVDISDRNSIALLYIAGYVASKIGKNANCLGCFNLLCCDADMSGINTDDFKPYLQDFAEYELKYPSLDVFMIAKVAYQVFQTILTSEFEKRFLSYKNQRKLFIVLVNELINPSSLGLVKTCSCVNTIDLLILNVINSIANILLNNYVYLYPKKIEKLRKMNNKK